MTREGGGVKKSHFCGDVIFERSLSRPEFHMVVRHNHVKHRGTHRYALKLFALDGAQFVLLIHFGNEIGTGDGGERVKEILENWE